MVERLQVYIPKVAENLLRIVVDEKGDWVRYSDYENLNKDLTDAIVRGDTWQSDCAHWEERAKAAESSNTRMREILSKISTNRGHGAGYCTLLEIDEILNILKD